MKEMMLRYKKLLVISAAFVTFISTGIMLSMDENNLHKHETQNVADARNISNNDVYNDDTISLIYGDDKFITKIIKAVDLKEVDSINIPIEVDKKDNKIIYNYGNLILELEYFNANKAGKQLINMNVKKKEIANNPISNTLLVANSNQDEIIIDTGISKTYKLLVDVVDKNAPVIELIETDVTLDLNDNFTASDYINAVYDEVDGTLDYEIDSNVDTSVAGDYSVVFSAVDNNGNKTSETMNVRVNEAVVVSYASYSNISYDASAGTDMISAINAVRSQYGLYPLQLDNGSLGSAAQTRAYESASSYGFYHYRPNGSSYTTALSQYGVSYNGSVELLVSNGSSYSSNLSWWLSSPVHSRHILTSSFTKIGLGYYGGVWCAILIN